MLMALSRRGLAVVGSIALLTSEIRFAGKMSGKSGADRPELAAKRRQNEAHGVRVCVATQARVKKWIKVTVA